MQHALTDAGGEHKLLAYLLQELIRLLLTFLAICSTSVYTLKSNR